MSRRQRVLEVAVAETGASYGRIVLEGAAATEDGDRTLIVDLSGGGGGAPSGPAGGDLGGTYPNPTVVDLTIASEARGDLLTRGASAWVRLAPGTSGYALFSAGAGADLTWGGVYTPGGTDIAVADGGTGASTAAAARANLGVTAYAPAYAASTPAGYQWAGGRLELAPCTSSFPAINLLTESLPGTTRRNSSLWVAATPASGTLALQVATGATDYSSAGHGCPTLLDRTAPNAGRAMTLTMHVAGSITATNTNGVGIGVWDGTTHGRTARIAVYYVSGAIKIYHGYSTTETATTITAGDLSTGVWLRLDIDTGGTLRIQYQIGATASAAPSSGWTTVYTVTDYLWSWTGVPKWGHVCYSVHGYNTTGATRTMPAITYFDDATMAGSAPRRSPLDGCGIGVSASSPEVTLFTDVAYSSSVATQAAIRTWAAAVAAQLPGETASVEFLVRSTNTPGSYTGSTWYAAGAIVAPAAAEFLEVKARIVSNGVQCGSLAVGAVSALRVA